MELQHQSFRSSRVVLPWLLMLVVFATSDASFALDIYVSVDRGAPTDAIDAAVLSLSDSLDPMRDGLALLEYEF